MCVCIYISFLPLFVKGNLFLELLQNPQKCGSHFSHTKERVSKIGRGCFKKGTVPLIFILPKSLVYMCVFCSFIQFISEPIFVESN